MNDNSKQPETSKKENVKNEHSELPISEMSTPQTPKSASLVEDFSDARANFLRGFNCSQAVFAAHSRDFGLEPEMALRITGGMGGGVGGLRDVCGAFSALALLAGLKNSPSNPDQKKKKEVYSMIQDMAKDFEENCGGSVVCTVISSKLASEKNADGTPKFHKMPCHEIVRNASEIAKKYLY